MNDIFFIISVIIHIVTICLDYYGGLPCHHLHEHSKQQFTFLSY